MKLSIFLGISGILAVNAIVATSALAANPVALSSDALELLTVAAPCSAELNSVMGYRAYIESAEKVTSDDKATTTYTVSVWTGGSVFGPPAPKATLTVTRTLNVSRNPRNEGPASFSTKCQVTLASDSADGGTP